MNLVNTSKRFRRLDGAAKSTRDKGSEEAFLPTSLFRSLAGICRRLREVEAEEVDLPGVRRQPQWIRERDRVAACETVEIQAPGEPEGIFLRKTPDRRAIVAGERRR